jgi:hypothetical protein
MPTRSRNLAAALGGTIANNVFGTDGSRSGAGITVYDYDSNGALLLTDNSSFADGSLHYLTNQRELYVWDDNESKFYQLDEISDDKLGGGSSNIQGSNYGYNAGGRQPGLSNVIDKFSLTSDNNATDVGDLVTSREEGSSNSSTTHGFTGGGDGSPTDPTSVESFAFASDGNATSVGDLLVTRRSGSSSSSSTDGYIAGGYIPSPAPTGNIEKFSLSSDADGVTVANLLASTNRMSGQTSSTHGYAAGGMYNDTGNTNIIQKYSHSVDENATDVGDLVSTVRQNTGTSSTTHGYVAGGRSGNPGYNYVDIQKFPFASDANATDVGDLTEPGIEGPSAGVSSTTYGYHSAYANIPVSPYTTTGDNISKYLFASDGNATDVGALTVMRSIASAAQY